jgi:hypothetical protein
MANGIYGTVRASDVSISDLDVYYSFTPNRDTVASTFSRLVSTDVLTENKIPTADQTSGEENLLEGLYNLKLPATIFNQTGIYTVYIRPKVIRLTITDCGVLSSLPTIKGIIINSNDLPSNLTSNNALQGYKIEYIQSDGTKLRNTVRYVTTSNKAVPVTENIGNTSQTAVRYRFDDAGNLLFLQVTPSSASNVKPNVNPFIGSPSQTILISNTNVNPEAIEIEMVKNTIDTVIDYVGGEQIKDVDNGIVTYYDPDRNIINQFDLYEIKDDFTNESLFEVKEKRTTIDTSQTFDNVTKDVIGNNP